MQDVILHIMLANQSLQQIPTNQTYKEVDQSKNIIKEALLSNPGLINNIMINLEEIQQNQETTQIAEHNPMEIFQQSEQNGISTNNRNDCQETNDQNDTGQAQEFVFQQEQQNSPKETEKQTKTQGAIKKIKKLARQVVNMEKIDKKSTRKTPKAEIASQQRIGLNKAKRSNDSKKQQMEVQNHKKTNPHQQKIKQCNFQIVIRQDKQILQMIVKKSKKKQEKLQQQLLKPISFRIEITLMKDDKSNQRMIEEKPALAHQKRPKNKYELQKSDFIEEQDQQPYNQHDYQNQNEQVQNYPRNNKAKAKEKINLGCLSLSQIVTILFKEELINQSLYDLFRNNHTIHDLDEFIKKFTVGKLATFDYKNIPFTLLDHRRLAELIFNLYPDKYFIGEIYSENVEVFNFLVSCYDLQSEMYYKLYKNIDQLSKVQWWKQLILNNKRRIDQAFKRKNAYRDKNPKERELQRKKFDEQLKEKTKGAKKGSKRF